MSGSGDFDAEQIPDAVIRVDAAMQAELANGAAARMFQLEPGARLPLDELLGPSPELSRWLSDRDGRRQLRIRIATERRNGVPFTADLAASRQAQGVAVCVLREIAHDRVGGEAQLYFDIAFETAPIGMALFDTDGRYTRVNGTLCRMLGYEAGELLGRRDQELTHPEDRASDVEAAWRILRGEIDTWQCEKRFVRADDSILWTIANLTFLRDPDGNPLSWVGQFQDITERKQREAQLRELADREPLTGLYNRRCFDACLEGMLARGERGAVLLIDLDSFKEINDTYGHRCGDHVLIGVAAALAEQLGSDCMLARVGGDEFAVILPGVEGDRAGELARLLADSIAELRFPFSDEAAVGASVGLGIVAPEHGSTLDSVLIEADMAMYRVKRGGDGHGGETVWRRRLTDWHGARGPDRRREPPELDRSLDASA